MDMCSMYDPYMVGLLTVHRNHNALCQHALFVANKLSTLIARNRLASNDGYVSVLGYYLSNYNRRFYPSPVMILIVPV